MDIVATAIPEVKLVRPHCHADQRGWFCETWSTQAFAAAGVDVAFVQDNHVLSHRRGTVRGLHFQTGPHAQAKLVRVVRGRIRDVAVDLRRGSPSYGRHVAVDLDESGTQLLVPAGFAHGYCTLSDQAEVLYKVSRPWAPTHEAGLLWCDPDLAIDWGVDPAEVFVAERDRLLPRLNAVAEART